MKRVRVLAAGLLQLLVGGLAQVGGLYAWRFLAHPAIVTALSLEEPVVTVTRRIGVLIAGVLAYWAFVRLYERRAVPELRLRLGWTIVAGVAGALSIGVTIAFLFASGHAVALSWRGFATSGDVLAQIGVAATLEELMFRALLYRILEERAGTRWALAVSALVFGVAHAANGGFSAISLVSVPLCGLLWAGVFVLSRNVWVASAHHACWNAAIFLSGLPLSGQEAWRVHAPLVSRYQGAELWSGGAFGPEDSLVNVVVCVLLCVALWRLAARADAKFPRTGLA